MNSDWRNIRNGREIPNMGYCDQPYIVVNSDGSWTCIMTTGAGIEGSPGQTIVAIRTTDRGQSWTEPVILEPTDGPEASWGMPFRTEQGRTYVFYTYNSPNLRLVKAGDENIENCGRVDTLGDYCFRFSDDDGLSWSDRHTIPVRSMDIDRNNPYQGEVKFFWGVGKPVEIDGAMYLGFAKVGKFGRGFMETSEGCFLRCENILAEKDPEKLVWETLPEGEHGLRAPQHMVADEANLTGLADGSLYCTYRTLDGHPCHAYSRDKGKSWTGPEYMTYTPDGQRVKHSRAANFVRRLSNGKYIYWFHNHGGQFIANHPDKEVIGYLSRNPVWLCGGVEKDGFIHWSQPEIVLYDEDPNIRISYPDFIEQDGKLYITETQKKVARVHEVPMAFLEKMWAQLDNSNKAAEDSLLSDFSTAGRHRMPELPSFHEGKGITLDCIVDSSAIKPWQTLFDSRKSDGTGILLQVTDRHTLRLNICGNLYGDCIANSSSGLVECSWETDAGMLDQKGEHLISFIVDGGPKVISVVVDGILCDGGTSRQYGWGRFHALLRDANGAEFAIIPQETGLRELRIHGRALLTSEAVSNWRDLKQKESSEPISFASV